MDVGGVGAVRISDGVDEVVLIVCKRGIVAVLTRVGDGGDSSQTFVPNMRLPSRHHRLCSQGRRRCREGQTPSSLAFTKAV